MKTAYKIAILMSMIGIAHSSKIDMVVNNFTDIPHIEPKEAGFGGSIMYNDRAEHDYSSSCNSEIKGNSIMFNECIRDDLPSGEYIFSITNWNGPLQWATYGFMPIMFQGTNNDQGFKITQISTGTYNNLSLRILAASFKVEINIQDMDNLGKYIGGFTYTADNKNKKEQITGWGICSNVNKEVDHCSGYNPSLQNIKITVGFKLKNASPKSIISKVQLPHF